MQALTDLRNAEARLVENLNAVADHLEAIGTTTVEDALARVELAAQSALARLQALTLRMTARLEAMTHAVNALADGMTTPATTTTTCTSSTTSGPTTTSTPTTGTTMSEATTSIPSRETSETPNLEDHPGDAPGDRVDAPEPETAPILPLANIPDAPHARNGRATATIPPPARTARRKRR